MKTIFETLEMQCIQQELKGYCASTLGQEKIDQIHIHDDLEDLLEALEKVHESMKMIEIQGKIPLGGLSDISLLIEKANRDGTLLGDELLKFVGHLECIISVKNYIDASEMNIPHLKEQSDGLICPNRLLDELRRCILPDGTVSDDASETLRSLRKRINQVQGRIRSKMESLVKESKDILTMDTLASKNDRLVLPVKTNVESITGMIMFT